MTPDTHRIIADIFASTRVLLLDFDGPVCDVFAGYPAADVAAHLRGILTAEDHVQLSADVVDTADPLHVIRRVGDLAPQLSPQLDAMLSAAEVEATATSRPTPGAVELLQACQDASRPVAIVSNNSGDAIHAYLDRHDLAQLVQHIQGRDPGDPHRMKPDPYPITQALKALDAQPDEAVLIGDSEADLHAAHTAGVKVIAYANKAGKADRFAPADATIDNIYMLAHLLSKPSATRTTVDSEHGQPATAE